MGNANVKRELPPLFMDEDYMLKNARIVYENDALGELKEGVCFIVSGTILLACEHFIIAFLVGNDDDDIALHLNTRLPHNYILRNTRIKKRWKVGESASSIPFILRRGHNFSIQVLITNSAFLISINDYHYTSYLHYIPFTLITKLMVKGDVTDISMQRLEVKTYPEQFTRINNVEVIVGSILVADKFANETGSGSKWRYSLVRRIIKWKEEISAPYLAALPKKSLKPGRYLKIEGRVKLLPTSFFINLQKNVYFWPHPIVAFHLGPRFSNKSENISKAKIVRCAWYDGAWSPEECSDIDTEFLPGKVFRMAIVCVEDAYIVYLNGKFLLEFKHHIRPETVDTIYIRGDVKLRWVSLHSTVDGRYSNTDRANSVNRSEKRSSTIDNSNTSKPRDNFINYENI